jgi:hypothetical protein
VWQRLEGVGFEVAHVRFGAQRLRARGAQVGSDYRLDYELETGDRYVTDRLELSLTTATEQRSLSFDRRELGDLLDIDIEFSPFTNTMPILRSGLHEHDGAQDFEMAWISVPGLTLHRSPQRYEHVRPGVVRYMSLDGEFRAELELDSDGLVIRYPHIAKRISP